MDEEEQTMKLLDLTIPLGAATPPWPTTVHNWRSCRLGEDNMYSTKS